MNKNIHLAQNVLNVSHFLAQEIWHGAWVLVKKSLYKTCLEYQIHSYTRSYFPLHDTLFLARLSLLFSAAPSECENIIPGPSFMHLTTVAAVRTHSSEIKTHNVFRVRVLNFYVKRSRLVMRYFILS